MTLDDTRLSPNAKRVREALTTQFEVIQDLPPAERFAIAHWAAASLILQIANPIGLADRGIQALTELSILCQQGISTLARPADWG